MLKAVLSAGAVAVLAVVMLVSRAPQYAEAATLFVFNPSDSGFGTLRWAVDQATENSSIDRIVIKTTVPITLYESVRYDGSQALMVQGDHALMYRVIQGMGPAPAAASHSCSLFVSEGGADITFYQLVFRDSPCHGIYVDAPDDAGEVAVTLNKTIIEDNAYNGVYLDNSDDDGTSFKLNVMNSFIRDNGVATEDEGDGVFVYDDYNGSITAVCTGSSFTGNGGNGLDLEEYGSGSVTFTATNCQFNNNGQNIVEGGAAAAGDEDEVEAAIEGSGDGVHVGEYGNGDVTVTLNSPVVANGNEDDGVNAVERGDGKLTLTATGVTADGNGDEGVDVDEEDAGNVTVKLTNTKTWNNDDNGVEAEESGDGDLSFEATGSSANFNGDDGYDVLEEDAGKLTGKFSTVVANANDDDGLDVYEYGSGAYSVTVYTSTVQGNGEFAVEAYADIETGTIAFGTSTILGGIDLGNINIIP